MGERYVVVETPHVIFVQDTELPGKPYALEMHGRSPAFAERICRLLNADEAERRGEEERT